ncbi:MAG: ribosome-associated translation inhibitor RaiA [Planctomycetaceae bacterium]|nr:ribosome-associated translation inhibitor RaiA [Planctomycetaceae bacterium]
MQINVSARHGEINDATKERIVQKLDKIKRFFDRLTAIDAVVDFAKPEEPALEVAVNAEKAGVFVASYQSGDLFGSLDQVLAKLEQQIKKHKEKLKERGKHGPHEEQ